MIKDLLEPPKLKTVRSPPLGGQEGAILGYDSIPIKLDPKRSFSFHHPQDTDIGHSLYLLGTEPSEEVNNTVLYQGS